MDQAVVLPKESEMVREFAQYLQAEGSTFDLMTVTGAQVCLWNILRYSLRNRNGKGKKYDLEKIAHYAEMA